MIRNQTAIRFLMILSLPGASCLSAQTGKVGINTTFPQAVLHVKDSSVLFSGVYPLPSTPGKLPGTGHGNRMLWYADKAAFRSGYFENASWKKDSIGTYSFASGYDAKALGTVSLAIGYATEARGDYSTALGFLSKASGHYSAVIGNYSDATGGNAIALGTSSSASGLASSAIGYFTAASGESSTALGSSTWAEGDYSTALGYVTHASGQNATAMGHFTDAIGDYSTAMGWNSRAEGRFSTALGLVSRSHGYASLTIGMYNDTIVSPEVMSSSTTPLFIIGNGTVTNRSNALVVRKDGYVGIGTNTPEDRIHIYNGSGKAAVRINSQDGDTAAIKIFEGSGFGFEFQYDGDNDLFHLWSRKFTGNEGIRMTWLKNGNVGIGTTSPSAKLHVEGNICYTGTIGACSDRRYKKNFTNLDNITSKLDEIHAYTYTWDVDAFPDKAFTNDIQIGLIAQEVQAVFPEIVMTDADGFLSVDYARLSVILLAGIKEQHSDLNNQQSEIAALRNEIRELKAQMNSMLDSVQIQPYDTR